VHRNPAGGVDSQMSEQQKPAFDSLEIGVLFVLLGLVVAIVIPSFVSVRPHNHGASCINNLKQIDGAANQFALENHLTNGDRIHFPNDQTPYIKLDSDGKIPPCLQGGSYFFSRVGDIPVCSLGDTVMPAHYLP
jgi:hypothetical protein